MKLSVEQIKKPTTTRTKQKKKTQLGWAVVGLILKSMLQKIHEFA